MDLESIHVIMPSLEMEGTVSPPPAKRQRLSLGSKVKHKHSQFSDEDEKENDNEPPQRKEKDDKILDLELDTNELEEVMELVNSSSPLWLSDLETMFDVLINQLHKKICQKWDISRRRDCGNGINIRLLENFWNNTFGSDQKNIQV